MAHPPARLLPGLLAFVVTLAAWLAAMTAMAQTPSPAWALSGGGNNDFIIDATGDADGNLYLAGYFQSSSITIGGTTVTKSGTGDNMIVAKIGANGVAAWVRNYGQTGTTARLNKIAVDATGNVYAAGLMQGGNLTITGTPALTLAGTMSAVVFKLDSSGTAAWSKNFGGSAQTNARAIALDSTGNVYLGGYMTGASLTVDLTVLTRVGSQDALLIKLDSDGNVFWAQNFGGTSATITMIGLATDSSGNAYGTGYFNGGSPTFGTTTLTRQSTLTSNDIMLVKFAAATGVPAWAKNYAGAGANAQAYNIAVDGSGNAYVSGRFDTASIDFDGTTLTTKGNQTMLLGKVDTSGTAVWAKTFGTTSANASLLDVNVDAGGNPYVIGQFNGATIDIGGTVLNRVGTQDVMAARFDTSGNTVWARNYGGAGTTVNPQALALTGTAGVALGGYFQAGPLVVGATSLTNGAGPTMFAASLSQSYTLTVATVGTGTVTSSPVGISCGATCGADFGVGSTVALTATAGTGYGFSAWSGDCSGTTASVNVTMSAARSCTATFTANGGGGGGSTPTEPPATPPAPPPFVNSANPPPTVVSADTTGSGQGTISLASSFTSTAGLSFSVSQSSGAALPSWLTFDPATVSFNYNVPLPSDLPVQPSADAAADTAARAVKAGRSIVNTVYPLSVFVQTIPVTLTVAGGGQSYVATINMDFYAPRNPVAITAISYSASGRSGDAPSARPSVSWDGGQVLFETTATNISPPANGPFSSVMRYHGLSGRRDLLSQTAIPGGGVANAAFGNSNNPAVAPAGDFAAFSSAAPGISTTANNQLRQVYRVNLVQPRTSLNEAATPTPVMVSTTAGGVAANAVADLPAISEHGEFVAFESAATNLGPNPSGTLQIWRKSLANGAIVLVSSAADGTPGNGDSRNVTLSWDGRFAAFDSTATNLVSTPLSGRHIYLKDLDTGRIWLPWAASGASNPKLDARATALVYVTTGTITGLPQILHHDIVTGANSNVSVTPDDIFANGMSTQPAISADGRFVAFRSTATDLVAGYTGNGMTQVWVRDVMRGATALVSQTEAGAPGSGDSADPAISGDGTAIAFTSLARDLVNGTPLPGQIHLAANPLVLPGRTAYWAATDGGNLTWSVERWGDRAQVAALAYNQGGGTAVWAAGACRFTGLTCQGTLSQWSQAGAAVAGIGPISLAFTTDGRQATAVLGNAAPRNLVLYTVGGTRATGFAGLPQSGYWFTPGSAAGANSLFIDTDTQVAANGTSAQQTHITLFTYDAQGNPQWYAAEGPIGADQVFTGQLHLYAGGSSWAAAGNTAAPSATLVGTLRLNFTAVDRATAQLPDGRVVSIQRWRF